MLQKMKRRILVHRKRLIILHVCSSMKHASLSRQPLHYCLYVSALNCNQDLFCTKTCLVPFVKPFPPFKLKSVLYFIHGIKFDRMDLIPMFVLHSGL